MLPRISEVSINNIPLMQQEVPKLKRQGGIKTLPDSYIKFQSRIKQHNNGDLSARSKSTLEVRNQMKLDLPQASNMYTKALYPSQPSIRVDNAYNSSVRMIRCQDELTDYDSVIRTNQLYSNTFKNSSLFNITPRKAVIESQSGA